MAGGKIFQTKTVDPTDPSIGGKVYQVTQVDPTDPHTQGMVYQVVNVGGGSATIEELNVTPSTSAQTIEATSSVDGYAPVNVAAVTSSIDANIVAGNIKKDITILGVTGSYEAGGGGTIEALNVTPSTSAQTITATGGVDGYSPVNVAAVDATIDANITAANIVSGTTILGVAGSAIELNGETVSVTPTTSSQTITPTSPKNAITEITVNAVTSSIDANITAGNIKKDVTILGVTGSYEGGTTPTGTISITNNGTYDVTNYASASVQVPTSGPSYYVGKVNDNGQLLNSSSIIDLTGVTTVGERALQYAYANNTSITGVVNLSSLTDMYYTYAMYHTFDQCTGITSVNLSNLTQIDSAASYCFQSAFSGCSNLLSFDLSSLEYIQGIASCEGMFSSCTALTGASLPSLVLVDTASLSGCKNMFYNCSGITNINLSSLFRVNGDLSNMFYGCSSLTSATFDSLALILSTGCMTNMFRNCTNLTSLSFPAINSETFGSTNKNQFTGLCRSVPNITLHFPSNMEPVVSTLTGYSTTAPFGATAGTVLFDLPASNCLNGANTIEYYRNPKYDTATALAWKQGGFVFTPYYTSGTSDPSVGDTIYSDAACTTPVTTIDSIV